MNKVYNIENLFEGNSYPGRGIILGCTKDNKSFIAYFIMGRSENSRNRIFKPIEGDIFTEPFVEDESMDKSLLIYRAVALLKAENDQNKQSLIVTNGNQTDTIYTFLRNGNSFQDALITREYEPDEPNWTPRISGIVNFKNGDFDYSLSMLRRPCGKEACKRVVYNISKRPGFAYCIHTYKSDSNPLQTYALPPKLLELPEGDLDFISPLIWNNLDNENKISLYTRITDPIDLSYSDRIWNKHR